MNDAAVNRRRIGYVINKSVCLYMQKKLSSFEPISPLTISRNITDLPRAAPGQVGSLQIKEEHNGKVQCGQFSETAIICCVIFTKVKY